MTLHCKRRHSRFADLRDASSKLRSRLAYLPLAIGMLVVVGCNPEVDKAANDNASDTAFSITPADAMRDPNLRSAAADSSAAQAAAEAAEAQATPSSPAGELAIGDPNPGLRLAKFVKGDEVTAPLKDDVTVVEFWATWCGPCRAGMPHISELQREYGDKVRFIGVTREDEDVVTKFLGSVAPGGKTWDEVIDYRLALDDGSWTNNAYMRAANQNGIPCAFIVGQDGIVEWIGHPGSIDQPLKQIVDGSWDRQAAVAEFKQQAMFDKYAQKLNGMLRSGNFDAALSLLDEMEESSGGRSMPLLNNRLMILMMADRAEEASSVRGELIEAAWDDATVLNGVAWETATADNATDLELALKAAKRASEIREDKDAAILDTLARCHYELGQLDEAIKVQQKAVDLDSNRQEITEALKRYQDEKAAADSN
ncbi:MAG: redoxin family protein [Rubripirellula sp.]